MVFGKPKKVGMKPAKKVKVPKAETAAGEVNTIEEVASVEQQPMASKANISSLSWRGKCSTKRLGALSVHHRSTAGFTFTGHGFTDGAMRGRAAKDARRAGWACVLVDDVGDVIAGLYGPCPDSFPTALRAKLRAVIQMLELALLPLTIWVDNN